MRLLRALSLAALLGLLASPAVADGTLLPPGSITAATVGAASATVVTAGAVTRYLEFINVSATATICLQPGTAAATIATAQCAAGEIPLAPLARETWAVAVPSDQFQAIASAGATQMTIIAK